jgi:Tol biopolymer transport system component
VKSSICILALSIPALLHAASIDQPEVKALAEDVKSKGWIAYSARSDNGDWDLFLTRPDGSAVRNITNTPDFSEAAPRFSYDGKQLLFRRLAKDAKIDHDKWGFQGQLMLASVDGSDAQAIGKDREFPWATWSPDGKQIACLTVKGIQIVDLAAKKVVRQIPRKGMYQQLGWSQDGKWFCGVSNHFGENWTVVRMSLDGSEINPVNSFQNCTPDWHPDSKRVIFSHRPGNQEGYGWTQLWIAGGDGKNRRLAFGWDGRHIYGGAASPDGQYLLFTTSGKDGGGSEKDGAPMNLMRANDMPTIRGESKALRALHPDTKDGPILELPVGWEPHWTFAEISDGKKNK